MRKRYAVTLMAVGLIAGLTLGWAATGIAATAPSEPAAATRGMQLRLGATMRESGSRILDIVARLTGLSTDEVIALRQSGKTFSEIASSEGVSEAALVSEVIDSRKAALAERVAAGDITQDQADAALANMESRLTSKVQTANPDCTSEGGARGGQGRGQGMGRGQGGGSCGGSGAGLGCTQ